MLEILWNLGSFIVALGILVTVHEYGHFWVARRNGVFVQRFSIGFGKVLVRWYDKKGTEYVIAAIPLGGYVKMLDERIEEVPEAQRHLSFNGKSIYAKIAIVAAGPMANFIFAIAVLALMYMIGVKSISPVIGNVEEGSRAYQAGLSAEQKIVKIGDEAIFDWREATFALMQNMGEASLPVTVTDKQGEQSIKHLNLSGWTLEANAVSPIHSIGVTPFTPKVSLQLAQIVEHSAADKAGLIVGDTIHLIDGEKIETWQQLVAIIQKSADKSLLFTITRNGEPQNLTVIPQNKQTQDGFSQGHLGVLPLVEAWPQGYITSRQFGPFAAIEQGIAKTWQMIALSFEMIANLVTGQVSVQNLSGPIGIAVGAGTSVSYGLVAFLSFLALISVNLGVFNLLPLPILDGGHLMYYLIELITKKPVSEKTQELGFRIGALILLLLTSLALFNDFMRL
ncbi:sigma E protease regulator RseP [Pseudoalteromonas tunicata]|uniref:Zinc metalloprotease n=1 Tax=Pseudoalteromonas tunicata D2 TaxID=87626 RepID=A4C5Z6_9GAMM|nr:sigma E protease regulator RseP [Pseudoalteromonas tunicata]ATC95373.1 regulator of sigma E protease [Pseudoalteromonas tunicata]AXT30960.1 sigma E protease regulator RseP [Pseudoalteromonas tunicata]EAR29400.1 membrane-associated protease [Pseudoalteromonas tunicata D2]MDP4984358.1 sigma E protease regulator RseP [Pseudoalteromonas tunicata]MDP5213053.1 sigma E protease regulator RseP [Pseudoalteromonas tunicata]